MNPRLRIWLVAATLLALICLHNVALGCPTCKNSLAGDPAHSAMVRGYFWSIMFLMSMPFLILGGVSAYFYYEIRRARARQAAAQAAVVQLDSAAADRGAGEVDVPEFVSQA